jgi:hypothetical protein
MRPDQPVQHRDVCLGEVRRHVHGSLASSLTTPVRESSA